MSFFDVRFMKVVCDDSGHEHPVCQSRILVDASTESEAFRKAQAELCRQKKTSDWSLFADVIETRPCQEAIPA